MNSEFMRATRLFTIFTFAFSLLIPVIPTIFESFGFNDAQLGWIYSILPLIIFMIAPLAGNLSDKLGRKYILRSAIILDILAITIFCFTNLSYFSQK